MQGWDIQQIDIKTSFLHGVLPEDETAYLEQPKGFEEPGKEGWVMRLMKSIYGMKQVGRIWNQTFNNAVTKWGFERIPSDWCVYHHDTETGTIIFAVHVDDIFSIVNPPEENAHFKEELHSKWKITDLGPAKFALGIAIEHDHEKHTISLSQTAFIDHLIEQFNLLDAHPTDTPMVQGLQIQCPDKSLPLAPDLATWIDATPYRELVGSLNYIAVATQPDISFAVGRLTSILNCYHPEHWSAALRILHYLKGTRTLHLVLGGLISNTLTGFSDLDYANCPDTSCSIAGYCFNLGSSAISWCLKKQDNPTDSVCYAEYTALHGTSKEAIFLRQLLQGLKLLPGECPPTLVYCDNNAAVHIAEDSIWHSNTKYFWIKLHYIQDQVWTGELKILQVPSVDNIADILMKSLNRSIFKCLCLNLGLRATKA